MLNLKFTTVFAVLLAVCCSAFGTEIFGHRGASADAPENTLAAFKLGYEQGADGVELDVHLTKDGKLAVIHDADTKRVAGVEGRVAERTMDDLRRLDVGRFGGWAGKGFSEKIPTLDEVLALVPAGKKLVIEIKSGVETLAAVEQSLRRASGVAPAQTVLITFHYDVAREAKKRFPGREVYWLYDYKEDPRTKQYPDLAALIGKAKQAGVDGLNLNHRFPLDAAAVGRIKGAGLKCYAWTVDDPEKARALVEAGVEGITTNRPAVIREALRASPAVR